MCSLHGACRHQDRLYEGNALTREEHFKNAQDARNWFESAELVAGSLETVPGYYSIHDTIGELAANPETKQIVLNSILGAAGRILSPDSVFAIDPETTAADATSVGMLSFLLGDKKETVLRVMHAALSKVKKG